MNVELTLENLLASRKEKEQIYKLNRQRKHF